jgi:hypothetical protein
LITIDPSQDHKQTIIYRLRHSIKGFGHPLQVSPLPKCIYL